jgi:type III secretory pathway lipoprotein EscJ
MTVKSIAKQIKHTIQLEIILPENISDLCWTSDGCGPQIYQELLKVEAYSQISRMLMKHEVEIEKKVDKKTSDIFFTNWLKMKLDLIESIKCSHIKTEQI